jgi:4-amino-4-deoxy-L-arabinose transferase-like glycosyltransferase
LPKRHLTNLALCLAVVPLLGWWLTGLFDIDEGFYAAVVAEMNRRGEWVTPFYNGQPWFEKPILAYWLAKPMLAVFGDMVGPRLPSVLSAIGCYLLVAWYARRRIGEGAATWSVAILGTSLLFIVVGRMMMTDMPLVLAFSAAMLTFWESLVGNPRWRLLTAGLLGIAVLAKGPVALAFFVLIAGWTFYREPDMRPKFRGQWLLGTLILAAVIGFWYVPVYLANGQTFVQKFLIEQNIGRFTGGDKAHSIKGAWTIVLYIPVILVGMMPWSLWIWKAWRSGTSPAGGGQGVGREEQTFVSSPNPSAGDPLPVPPPAGEGSFQRYLWAWAIIVFLFFSASSAKLPHYVLPVFVPLAMLLGAYFARKRPVETPISLLPAIILAPILAIVANVGFLWWYQASGQAEAHTFARYIRDNSLHRVPRKVAMFQIGKQEGRAAAGTLKLQETSLPSFLLYLDATATETDSPREVVESRCHWLFTRKGRITPTIRTEFGRFSHWLRPIGPSGSNYELYEVVKVFPGS